MKFLLALTVLASTTAFAEGLESSKWVKCYDTAQGTDREVVYKMKKHHGYIRLVYPTTLEQNLRRDNGCLESDYPTNAFGDSIRFCQEQGQRVNGLVPIGVTYGQEEDTVYCDKTILRWLDTTSME